jgi:hypothetical protein
MMDVALYLAAMSLDNETLRRRRPFPRYGPHLCTVAFSVVPRSLERPVPPVLRSKPCAPAAIRRRSSSRLNAFNRTSA